MAKKAAKAKVEDTATTFAAKPAKTGGAVKFSVSSDGATIDRMTIAFLKTGETWKNQAAIIAASCVLHAIEHSDITKGLVLIKGLEADASGKHPWRLNALREWFVKEGPYKVEKVPTENGKTRDELKFDAGKRAALKSKMDADWKHFASGLQSRPFWIAKPEPEFKAFDFDAELKKLIAKGEAYSAGKGKASKLTPEQKAQIKLGSLPKIRAAFEGGSATVH
jgi:hypothetical protein